MRIGGAMFFTDYSMSPTELARALRSAVSICSGCPNTPTYRLRARRPTAAEATSRSNIPTSSTLTSCWVKPRR